MILGLGRFRDEKPVAVADMRYVVTAWAEEDLQKFIMHRLTANVGFDRMFCTFLYGSMYCRLVHQPTGDK